MSLYEPLSYPIVFKFTQLSLEFLHRVYR